MRRNLIKTALLVALLVVLLAPAAQLLSDAKDSLLDAKQAAIARALEMEQARKAQAEPVSVQPAAEDIEAIWAIEDARTEAEGTLVHEMYRGADRLGYDSASATFYCTLGIGLEDWPEIALSARGEENVQVIWLDDYTYDWPSDAIRDGYRYELLAYTDTEFAYIGVVFTGLPIVSVDAEGTLGKEDAPGRATVSAAGYDAIDTAMIIHERGGGYTKPVNKWSYRLEFHQLSHSGKDEKRMESVLGMPADSDWLLLANAQDLTTVRNKIAWEIWNDWHAETGSPMCMQSEMVELFINGEYKGIYQLMQRVQPEQEILRMGGNLSTDSAVRIVSSINPSDKPQWSLAGEDVDFVLEYLYDPSGNAQRLFDKAKDYVELSRKDPALQLDDAAFEKLVLERIDIESMIDYILFFHACTLRDNIGNNVYLYLLRQEDGRLLFHHAPWDMDTAFWVKPASEAHNSTYWPNLSMVIPNRILTLNIGNAREIMWDTWREKRATVISDEAIYARFTDMEEYINASGAYLRDSEKWYGEAIELNLSEMEYYEEQNLKTVELVLENEWPIDGAML